MFDPGHQTGGVIRPAGLTRLTGVTRPISPICIEYKINGEITVDHEKFPISSFDRSVSGREMLGHLKTYCGRQ